MLRNKTARILYPLTLAISLAPPALAGYWEEMFGRPQQPAFRFDDNASPDARRQVAHAARRRLVSGARWRARQEQAQIRARRLQAGEGASDETLRRGDAVVSAEGVKVYVGADRSDRGDGFVSLEEYGTIDARLSARLRAYFSPLSPEKARRYARPRGQSPNSVKVAKAPDNAAPPAPASSARLVTAANGKKVRLVGGYFPRQHIQ